MKKYEYKVLRRHLLMTDEDLKPLGLEGWLLITVLVINVSDFRYHFQREIIE